MPNENDPSRRMFVICYYRNTVLYSTVQYSASFLLLSHTICFLLLFSKIRVALISLKRIWENFRPP